MASSAARGPPCRERSLRERPGRRSGSAGRSRSRSGEREGEQRVLREELPAGDLDCEDEREAAKSPKKPVRPQVSPGGAVEGRGESSANGAVPSPRAAGKRGRKGKAEVLLLELSQAPEPIRMQKVLGSSEEGDGLETPRGGRPKRKAAKVALLYLQELAEELMSACQPPAPAEGAPELEPEHVQRKRRSRRRKEEDTDSDDPTRDADFVPSQEVLQAEEEEEEEEEEGSDTLLSEASEPELEAPRGHSGRTAATGRSKPQCRGLAPNGFHNSIMAPVEKSSSLTCSLREQKHSQWEFPDWIPVAHRWMCLSDRFSSLQPHPERLDVSFFVGGPVWAMEWCPTPEGSAAPQYVAVSCHRSMEETHSVSGLHSGPALLQLWGLGVLQTEPGSPNKARLAYAIAADYGCVWDMKFCPSGAWEPPTTARTHPQMSRLGLLAAAFSDGRVVVYALPHPGALHHAKTTQVKDGSLHKHLICKVQCIATLQVGSIQAGNASECGQCFSLSWMPSKPHHHLAAGFYDGTVAVWNLLTKSLLQCVQQPDASLKLYPFRCFLAHDHAVRSIEWCKADSNFLVTVGSDRKIKFWDLRRLYEPINSIKRFLSTEVAWLLPYNGITVAQDNCYASYGLCGIHYIDAGYLGFKAYFVAPRKGTVWSISGSDWLNTVAAGDITGELVAAVLPDLAVNPLNVKRSSDRRFPVYKADLLPCSPDGPEGTEQALPRTHRYSEMIARSYIRFQDTDLRSFQNFPSREPMRRMHMQELKAELSLDRLQLEALHKVRFSPNLDSQGWLVSGGQAGIVRVHCLAGLASSVGHQLLPECRARFSFLYGDTSSSPGPPEGSLLPAE
ncbi:general transcription factor 3C polypeptide 2 isoform X2 [Corvus kubaryi]|uniref:general transcription factor 3C polypeptide 2 isoform X2 n=1 Tax=Corvus moneduloides TaxID=1196302 RepID=UPI0013623D03|nr:general transcription factor 3C polypeptide 2 isoform X2 [Corvus moneduloides]XP_041885358.1 general transcription factor 3C polypeptide 2 isoform X2 [Corvus kubaryi]